MRPPHFDSIITTALKRRDGAERASAGGVHGGAQRHRVDVMRGFDVHACSDVTGLVLDRRSPVA